MKINRNISLVLISLVLLATALRAEQEDKKWLPEGFILKGQVGQLTFVNDTWFFRFDSEIGTEHIKLEAGTAVELLPTSALEKILQLQDKAKLSFKIWGKITEYKKKNYIFSVFFVPTRLVRTGQQEVQRTDVVSDPNDVISIPNDILLKLQSDRIMHPKEIKAKQDKDKKKTGDVIDLYRDSVLSDRAGIIRKNKEGQWIFVPYGLGKNVQKLRFFLLPCQVLESAQSKESLNTEYTRFKVSGILTRYKNNNYLLLQKATPVYNHGNF